MGKGGGTEVVSSVHRARAAALPKRSIKAMKTHAASRLA